MFDKVDYGALVLGRFFKLWSLVRWYNQIGFSLSRMVQNTDFRLFENPKHRGGIAWADLYYEPLSIYGYKSGTAHVPGLYAASSFAFATPTLCRLSVRMVANLSRLQNVVGVDVGILIGRLGN